MPKSGTTKTFVACRPGLAQQMKSAFPDMDVVVDDTMTSDYEFRQAELTGMDLVIAELEQEERIAADPKHAHTFVVPLLQKQYVNVPEDYEGCSYLLVRVEDNVSRFSVEQAIQATKLQADFLGEVQATATISELKQSLKDAGINVLSISEAEGVTRLAE